MLSCLRRADQTDDSQLQTLHFTSAEIELGNPVVFIGPNNSGKTTALQAIALWEVGLRRSTINRKDLFAVPVPNTNLLWKDLQAQDVRIEIVVEGVTGDRPWTYGLGFEYANEESLYCRSLENTAALPEAFTARVVFLAPMSALADREFFMQPGEIGLLIGEGRTAEILRNLCLRVVYHGETRWQALTARMRQLFGIELDVPEISDNREVTMTYREPSGVRLDLASAGRGVHQTLLLLAYLSAIPNSVLLLDEPDAHMEILRQHQIYNVIRDAAREQESQVVIASHSEGILNEAAGRDVIVTFVGHPHRLNDRPTQLLKALKDIGFEDYRRAEQRGWVLYVDGFSDLVILRTFAAKLQHAVRNDLESPLVHYIGKQPSRARDHFYGLLEAKPESGWLSAERQDGASAASHSSPHGGDVGEA